MSTQLRARHSLEPSQLTRTAPERDVKNECQQGGSTSGQPGPPEPRGWKGNSLSHTRVSPRSLQGCLWLPWHPALPRPPWHCHLRPVPTWRFTGDSDLRAVPAERVTGWDKHRYPLSQGSIPGSWARLRRDPGEVIPGGPQQTVTLGLRGHRSTDRSAASPPRPISRQGTHLEEELVLCRGISDLFLSFAL